MSQKSHVLKNEEAAAAVVKQAREAVLDTMFEDLYRDRWKAYKFNLFRGLFFGLGSALGGTVAVALVVWILSWFVDWPLVGHALDALKK